jgi:hypothetical protein
MGDFLATALPVAWAVIRASSDLADRDEAIDPRLEGDVERR